jgi:hypothetical protein
VPLTAGEQALRAETVAAGTGALGPFAFDAAVAQGRELTLSAATALAHTVAEPSASHDEFTLAGADSTA